MNFFFLAYEIWGLVKFHQQCHSNLRHVNNILVNMEANKQNMTRTFNRVNGLMTDYETVSNICVVQVNFDIFKHNNVLKCFFKSYRISFPYVLLENFSKVCENKIVKKLEDKGNVCKTTFEQI